MTCVVLAVASHRGLSASGHEASAEGSANGHTCLPEEANARPSWPCERARTVGCVSACNPPRGEALLCDSGIGSSPGSSGNAGAGDCGVPGTVGDVPGADKEHTSTEAACCSSPPSGRRAAVGAVACCCARGAPRVGRAGATLLLTPLSAPIGGLLRSVAAHGRQWGMQSSVQRQLRVRCMGWLHETQRVAF